MFAAAARSWRRATTDIRLTTPIRMRIDSTVREATYPRATLSLTRFTIGKMTTAVAMPAIANRISSRAPTATRMSVAAADNVVGVVQDRVVETEGRDRDECGKEPGTHDPRGSLLRSGRCERTLTGSIGAQCGRLFCGPASLRSGLIPSPFHSERLCGVS